MACKFYLYKGKGRNSENGHLWIYANEIENFDGEYENGDIIEVYNFRQEFIGKGFINDVSKIAIRIMTRDIHEEIDEEFFRKKLAAAWKYRQTVIDTSSCRFLFGEADFVPGMIIDKYEDYYVIQSLALGIDKYKDIVVKLLMQEYSAKGVYERSDARVRELEGMEKTTGFLTEPFDTDIEIIENGVKYYVDIANGQKTGFFLDQKENRAAIHRLCKDADVLDCFTHTGSFALNAGIAGAKSVLGVDISEYAVDCCRKNAELNGLSGTVKFECHNAFDVLREWSREKRQYDVVILDPPAFSKSRSTIDGATRGYKEINLRGIKLVKPGGYFVTCSCSHFMYPDIFRDTIADAALDAKRTLRQVEFRTQASDHPILWNSDESYYLKFYIFQVV
ncbi:class I SAM-dependent rRNA methyltransferase [Clostridium sp. CM028]|uniref:class I SAM-dependent rRNA methyltransferase n=1 Tax=unclassified Clostridium TaxID=2614128 RepID=UPI001C0D87F4|nr:MULTISPECIES: class I SAM-dependent rRNA methyltransferase [unclassified Clostridium]MBU3093046.1 class I SAM-dependent rRNA methyltransferase [Clostridium sp. CF011]MBW9145026.1 class I SAM-dependent rRNA methyltransferase [Clostridium sp. CM027]MBW9148564.1 class I SAM-dependent rRNA methyltransferase [Clostridium sp. CM028]UVE40157.1 class I SAM-dependent rRNA methyltransferase [Clostridium sp. CM027]WAG69101.1 class I SAM-dependent rRNA methyltransferase [Clostridium sp. CF011]